MFQVEQRYLTLKFKDLQACNLSADELQTIGSICARLDEVRIKRGAGPFKALVIEQDWEVFETACKLVQMQTTISDMGRVLSESYQVASALATDAGRWDDKDVQNAMTNMATHEVVHEDVLPFKTNTK